MIDGPQLKKFLHNFVNLHIFPNRVFRLGQFQKFSIRDASIVLERSGNRHGLGKNPITYLIEIEGPGFKLLLEAVWSDEDSATADVEVINVTPYELDTYDTVVTWFELALNVPPARRDWFVGL